MVFQKELKATITHLTSSGLGAFKENIKHEGVVPYVLPGEDALVQKHTSRGQTHYDLKEILKPSKGRVPPPCPYFGRCGGCLLQHMNDQTQEAFKLHALTSVLKAQGIHCEIMPLTTVGSSARRRLRLELIKKGEKLFMGLKRFRSHQIIDLESCVVSEAALSDLISPLKDFLTPLIQDKVKATCLMTSVTNGIDVVIQGDSALKNLPPQELALTFMAQHKITRLQIFDALYEREQPHLLWGDLKIPINPQGFLQASASSEQWLQRLVSDWLLPLKKGPILDLFCGQGTFSIPLTQHREVEGFESCSKALSALNQTAASHKLPLKAQTRDLFENPLSEHTLEKYAGCVVNPPRAGLLKQAHSLAKSSIKRVCYVSCSPETFARDAQLLVQGNYELERLFPIDQFHWAPHLEVVGYFKHKKEDCL